MKSQNNCHPVKIEAGSTQVIRAVWGQYYLPFWRGAQLLVEMVHCTAGNSALRPRFPTDIMRAPNGSASPIDFASANMPRLSSQGLSKREEP